MPRSRAALKGKESLFSSPCSGRTASACCVIKLSGSIQDGRWPCECLIACEADKGRVKPIVAVPKRVADPLRAVSATPELGLVGNWRPRAPEPSFLRRDQCLNPRHAESARRDPRTSMPKYGRVSWVGQRGAIRALKHDEPRFGTTSAALPGASTYAGPRPLTKDFGWSITGPSSCHSRFLTRSLFSLPHPLYPILSNWKHP
jgi:hypothetical protein